MQQDVGCCGRAYRRTVDVTQRRVGGSSATSALGPLGSLAWHSVLQGPGAGHGGVGTGSPAHGGGALHPSPCVAGASGSLCIRWLIFLQYLKQK